MAAPVLRLLMKVVMFYLTDCMYKWLPLVFKSNWKSLGWIIKIRLHFLWGLRGDEDWGGVGDTPGLGDAKTWIIPNRNLGFLWNANISLKQVWRSCHLNMDSCLIAWDGRRNCRNSLRMVRASEWSYNANHFNTWQGSPAPGMAWGGAWWVWGITSIILLNQTDTQGAGGQCSPGHRGLSTLNGLTRPVKVWGNTLSRTFDPVDLSRFLARF